MDFFDKCRRDVETTSEFIKWLEDFSFEQTPLIEWTQPSFRIVTGKFDPLSIEGSLAAGGRFNIGGAQVSHFFPRYRMQGMLYAASTKHCAYAEAGELLGSHQLYALQSKKPLFLWDLLTLLTPHAELRSAIDATPFAAHWVHQKVPKVSQIFGSFLRRRGGDGIIYPSTKDPGSKTLAFFALDHTHMSLTFEANLTHPQGT